MEIWILSGLSALAALAFGFVYLAKPPSPLRTGVKTLFMAPLALALILLHAPALLIAAAIVSAIGDAVLALDKKEVLPFGILAFLTAQLCYLALFHGLAVGVPLDGVRFTAAATIAWAALVFLIWLWPKLGPLVYGVVPYTLAIAAMAMQAMLLPGAAWPAMVGVVCFFVSDAVLSAELFRMAPDAKARRITTPVVWWSYVAAQALIIWGVMRVTA